MIVEVSVQGWWTALSLALWWHRTSWREHTTDEATHLVVAGKPGVGEGGIPMSPSRARPSVLTSFQ